MAEQLSTPADDPVDQSGDRPTVRPRARQRRVTRADVARAAGTSSAVVSYVVNDGPRPVSAATRAKVLAAIDELGYRPNSVARSLVSGKSGVLGLVVPDISNSFFAAVAHAMENAAVAHGKVLLLGNSAESVERERELVATFLSQQIDGLAHVGVSHDSHAHYEDQASAAGVPLVVLDRIMPAGHASSVLVDNRGGARLATSHLIEHGHHRIGIVEGPADVSTSIDRTQGWYDAMTQAGLVINPAWRVTEDFTKEGGHRAGQQLLSLDDWPEALFVCSEQQALGLLRAAYQKDVKVPEDLALFTFDGTSASEFSLPPLSTVVQPFDELARVAVETLLDDDASGSEVQCDYSVAIRRSCGCS